jgi:hypothetical protein
MGMIIKAAFETRFSPEAAEVGSLPQSSLYSSTPWSICPSRVLSSANL